MSKSIVLLSGGLDSTVNLTEAAREGEAVMAVTFDYGQESATREIAASAAMCARAGIRHTVIQLPWLKSAGSALTGATAIPDPDPDDLDKLKDALVRADAVWVPNRNGIFLNIAAGLAEQEGVDFVVPGFNAEEAAAFPDNSPEFIKAQNKALNYSTRGRVAVKCYTSDMRKDAVAALGQTHGAHLDLVWSCYRGGELMCGRCESCLRLARAYSEAGLSRLLDGRMAE